MTTRLHLGLAVAVVASAGILASSLAGSAAVLEAQEDTRYPVSTISCENNATHALHTGFLLNNQWNRQLAGAGPWQQCLLSRVRDGRNEFGWSWKWPRRDGLYAYPELLVGHSPWMEAKSNDPRFPRRIADTPVLDIEYDIESTYQGKRNLALEFWFTRSPLKDGESADDKVKAELMIWTDASSGMVSKDDKLEAIVDISGQKWALYVQKNWGDLSGGSAHRWDLITYIAVKPSLSARYDARRFFQDAIDRGLLDTSDYIADIELGNEIVSGTGSTWIRKFRVAVE